ncbi:protein SODIUM POTASSIUM ROOT DEFECTIVE 2-like [Lolium rigidum]|uniref:protein SODIUM POTASSIUM ROOT DEFECTIVE 2-like n=1 Tax=Lolium rigidum TaxID=89674 RepID=UPI001F5E203B|nr:protein SODIUM POTASSIUM ROOT DEFECTIVE 2-like [Lolium rigidum]
MRSGGMMCRSHAATAVCVPGDARSMVVGRRADRTIAEDARILHDVRYVRLGGGGCDGAGATRVSSRRAAAPPMPRRRGAPVAVTLPMVTKSPKETPARDTAAAKRTPAAPPTAAPATGDQVLQVVVMKVAIHCQGCAGKVRKHISKMEGVTSFSIDVESKKVTVMGHVSPAGVLESISRVKKAELLLC